MFANLVHVLHVWLSYIRLHCVHVNKRNEFYNRVYGRKKKGENKKKSKVNDRFVGWRIYAYAYCVISRAENYNKMYSTCFCNFESLCCFGEKIHPTSTKMCFMTWRFCANFNYVGVFQPPLRFLRFKSYRWKLDDRFLSFLNLYTSIHHRVVSCLVYYIRR